MSQPVYAAHLAHQPITSNELERCKSSSPGWPCLHDLGEQMHWLTHILWKQQALEIWGKSGKK